MKCRTVWSQMGTCSAMRSTAAKSQKIFISALRTEELLRQAACYHFAVWPKSGLKSILEQSQIYCRNKCNCCSTSCRTAQLQEKEGKREEDGEQNEPWEPKTA